jgi:hypothetical protein
MQQSPASTGSETADFQHDAEFGSAKARADLCIKRVAMDHMQRKCLRDSLSQRGTRAGKSSSNASRASRTASPSTSMPYTRWASTSAMASVRRAHSLDIATKNSRIRHAGSRKSPELLERANTVQCFVNEMIDKRRWCVVRTKRFAPRNSTPCTLRIKRMEMSAFRCWRCGEPNPRALVKGMRSGYDARASLNIKATLNRRQSASEPTMVAVDPEPQTSTMLHARKRGLLKRTDSCKNLCKNPVQEPASVAK